MTPFLADIKPWEGHIVPGEIDPRYRQGVSVNLEGKPIRDVQAPTQELKAKPGLGEGGDLIKQLVNVLQKNVTSEMTEALPQYRSV